MFHHILVPLDGSRRAEQALPVAAQIARATGGSLLLVRVVSPFIDFSGGMEPVPLVNEQTYEEEMASAALYLRSLAASQECTGVDIGIEVCYGLPVPQLLACVQASEIDLVVLCSHGRTGFTRWVLGSVAHALVHQCTHPILVLRQDEAFPTLAHAAHTGMMRALVPLDGSPLAEAALLPAAHLTSALAAPGQGTLHLSQVVRIFPTSADEGFISELNVQACQRAETYLSQVQERLCPQARDLHLLLTHAVVSASDVANELVNLAEHSSETGPCELIAIATHGRAGLERWVMGSVTQRVLNATKLPILIVRSSDKR
jgi:nucleotide-binding universal stress UspA family protein